MQKTLKISAELQVPERLEIDGMCCCCAQGILTINVPQSCLAMHQLAFLRLSILIIQNLFQRRIVHHLTYGFRRCLSHPSACRRPRDQRNRRQASRRAGSRPYSIRCRAWMRHKSLRRKRIANTVILRHSGGVKNQHLHWRSSSLAVFVVARNTSQKFVFVFVWPWSPLGAWKLGCFRRVRDWRAGGSWRNRNKRPI